MKVAAPVRVCVLGAVLCVALSLCAQHFGERGGRPFLISLASAGAVYLLAICEFFAASKFPKRVVAIGLVLAAFWHLQFLRSAPGPDDDIHRYVWDGRLQHLGYNPYLVVPSDPSVARLHTSETRNLNNPNLPSPYPAGAQFFFRAVTAIQESAFALKVAFVACEVAITFLLLDVLRRSDLGIHLVLAYAWNPLLAVEVAGSGHIDVVGTLLLLISFVALSRRLRAIAASTFGLAIAIKLLPIVLLPIYWKRVRLRDAVLAITAVALVYIPFSRQGQLPIGSLITYVQTFRFNDLIFAGLERIAPQIAAGLPPLVGFLTAVWLRSRFVELSPDLLAWPMAASLLCAPVVYPWYLVWLLPFLISPSTVPITIWTVSIIPVYVVWHLRTLGQRWLVPDWIALLEYGSVAAAGVVFGFYRFSRPAESRL